MKQQFAQKLYELMSEHDKIIVLTADLGFGLFDKIRRDFPSRFYNVGSSEQLMIGIGIGLYYKGFIPVCYSITPFLLYRPFEMIRNYVNYEKVPLKLVGCGRNKDYSHDGFTHWADDDEEIIKTLKNIEICKPVDDELTYNYLKKNILSEIPVYLNISRS
jgi:transketolase